jgi:predicted nucleic acid-binding protein
MILVVDANVMISALLRDSKTREILMLSGITLYSPDTLIESIEKYKEEFIEKSGLSKEEFDNLLNLLLERVSIVKKEEYESKLDEANRVIGHIDIEDVAYIALALSTKNARIWSDDEHFQKQDEVKIFRTEDVVKIVEEGLNS